MPTTIKREQEISLEGEKDQGIEGLQLDKPDERPWGKRVDQYHSEESFQQILDSAEEVWKEQILNEVENQVGESVGRDERELLIQNAETLIHDELLRIYQKLLDQDVKIEEIEGIISGKSGSMGDQDAFREAIAKQLIIREGVKAGMNESDPSEMMDERFKTFVENTAGDSYYDSKDEAIINDQSLFLKGHVAGSAVNGASTRQLYTQKVSDTMSEILYRNDQTASDDKRTTRSAEIERKLNEYF